MDKGREMAKRVRDAQLETRAARGKLEARGRPYYRSIGPGLHVGYRKGTDGGKWVVRIYLGERDYRVETIANADDRLDPDGERVLTFWDAQEKARDLFRQLSGGGAKPSGAHSVRDAIEAYLAWMEVNRKSARDARYRADALILPELGQVEVSKLTAQSIRNWLRKLAETPARLRTKVGSEQRYQKLPKSDADAVRRRRATANRTLTVLKAALNYAWREGRVPSDAEWRRVEPYEDVETARVRYLTVSESQRLIRACPAAFASLVEAALQTGARYGELTRLRVEDFNADVGTVTIRESKSGKPRHVVLTDEGSNLFQRLVVGKSLDALILENPSGNQWGTSHQARPFREACKLAKIVPPIAFHGLRHTWASLAVMNGVPLIVVARNLGHTDTRMVEKHYGHFSASFVAEAIRAGAPRFGSTAEAGTPLLDESRT